MDVSADVKHQRFILQCSLKVAFFHALLRVDRNLDSRISRLSIQEKYFPSGREIFITHPHLFSALPALYAPLSAPARTLFNRQRQRRFNADGFELLSVPATSTRWRNISLAKL